MRTNPREIGKRDNIKLYLKLPFFLVDTSVDYLLGQRPVNITKGQRFSQSCICYICWTLICMKRGLCIIENILLRYKFISMSSSLIYLFIPSNIFLHLDRILLRNDSIILSVQLYLKNLLLIMFTYVNYISYSYSTLKS